MAVMLKKGDLQINTHLGREQPWTDTAKTEPKLDLLLEGSANQLSTTDFHISGCGRLVLQ